MKILIADDSLVSRHLLEATLRKWGYEVVVACDGEEALALLQKDDAPALAILDWMMPGMTGLEVCRRVRVRAREPYTYILLLTSKSQKEDLIEGMEAGADDYITKPFDLRELDARIQAVMRRYRATSPAIIRTAELVLDDERKEVVVRGQPVELSPKEFELLRLLASKPGKVFSTDEIVAAVWPDRDVAAAEDVKKYVHMLRNKIERDPADPKIIVTARGFGYRFALQPGPGPIPEPPELA